MKTMMLILCVLLVAGSLEARDVRPLDGGWRFVKGDPPEAASPALDDSRWDAVRLPHTWNAVDGERHGAYYRGPGWYRREIDLPPGGKAFVRFGAASQAAEVFCDGRKIGEHRGGFTAFAIDVSSCARPRSLLAVRVTNAPAPDLAPLKADFTFFGGLYRGAALITTGDTYISPQDYGSSGVYLTPSVKDEAMSARVELANESGGPERVALRVRLRGARGNVVGEARRELTLPPGRSEAAATVPVPDPHVWDGVRDPYLYHADVTLEAPGGGALDAVHETTGFRTVAVDPRRGFLLNGRPLDLRGVGMHQDWRGKGWALGPAERRRNVALLREMGANAVRLAHYPHAPATLSLLDRAGIVAWSEIPLVDEETPSAAFAAATKAQLEEMIHQNYNHPSIAFWGLFNELKHDPLGLVPELDRIARREDPSRITVGATDCTPSGRTSSGTPCDFSMAKVPQAIAFNRYDGWYYGDFGAFGAFLDGVRKLLPGSPVGISEYGAGASVNQHEEPPRRPERGSRFYPEEYQSVAHEAWLGELEARPGLFGHFAWNLSDFAAANRDEGEVPGRNDKGLVTADRGTKKDAFYFYEASWRPDVPVLHLTSARFARRGKAVTPVKVYSNLSEVELVVNGESLGVKRRAGDSVIFVWESVRLRGGKNVIEVRGGGLCERAEWEVAPEPFLAPHVRRATH